MSKINTDRIGTRDGTLDIDVKSIMVRSDAMENLGDYEQGIELAHAHEFIVRGDSWYTAKTGQAPYVLTGVWEYDKERLEIYGAWDHSSLKNRNKEGSHSAGAIAYDHGSDFPDKSLGKELQTLKNNSSDYQIVDSFEQGATITERNQALQVEADGRLYRWAGDLPKTVAAGSSPETTGGAQVGAWLEVSDLTLRQELANPDKGAAMVGFDFTSLPTSPNNISWAIRTVEDGVNILRYIPTSEWAAILDGTSTTNLTEYIQEAIDATYGKKLIWPTGRYCVGSLNVYECVNWIGGGHGLLPVSYENTKARLVFSYVPAGGTGLNIGDGTRPIIGLSIAGFGMSGSLGIDCMSIGKTISGDVIDAVFRDINIYKFRRGIVMEFMYDSKFDNVRVQNTVDPLVCNSQSNAILFSRCAFVTASGRIRLTNCEGIHFDTCDISNLSSEDVEPIVLFQSTVTFTNPYFENIAHIDGIVVGTGLEANPSSLEIINLLKYRGYIRAANNTYVNVSGNIRGSCEIRGTGLTQAPRLARVSNASSLVPGANRLVHCFTAGQHPRLAGYGGTTVSYSPKRGYTTVSNPGGGATGVWLANSALTVGKVYTLALMIRKGAATPIVNPRLRHGSVLLGIGAAESTEEPTLRKYPLLATDASLVLQFSGEIDLFGYYIEEGNEAVNLIDKFSVSANQPFVGTALAQPTDGAWVRGDIVWNDRPTVEGAQGWRCVSSGSPGGWVAF